MKTKNLYVPLSMTAALAGMVACAVSCAKKSREPAKPVQPSVEPVVTNTVPAVTNLADEATNTVAVTNVPPAETAAVTNSPGEITNLPPAETTSKAPEPNQVPETDIPGHKAVVEMATNAPAAPQNFYAADVATNAGPKACLMTPATGEENGNYYLTLRAGYEHTYHGDNNDSYYLSAKFLAWGDGLRESAGANRWLVPDMAAELSTLVLAKPDQNRHPGSDDGLRFRADFTWPWLRWTSQFTKRTNSVCPFCQPMEFRFGPTANLGFDHLYDEADFRFSRYGGLRLTFNRSGFVECTVGGTDGLDGTRLQLVTEIPFYESRDHAVRYFLRGLWNHGDANRPDILEGGLFVEMPFTMLVTPEKWGDFVPCVE